MLIKLSESPQRTGVPYGPADRPESKNWGYIDLKRHPESIGEVPELTGAPELRDLVESVNKPNGFFRTIGCEKAVSKHDGVHRQVGYVEILFEILDLNRSRDNWKKIFSKFQDYARSQPQLPSDSTVIEFEIAHVVFNEHECPDDPKLFVGGRSAVIWITGLGETSGEARENWGAGIVLIRGFLESTSEGKRMHLEGKPTVS